MTLPSEQIRPVGIEDLAKKEILVTWGDGHRSLYAYPYLRSRCRCAACLDEWTGASKILPEKISNEIHPVKTRAVGNYGVRFDWSDGHATGIYAFDYLRSICPCEACRAV